MNNALQEQLIIKNTIEVNLKQANDKKDSIMLEYQGYTQENDDMQAEITDINKNSTVLNEELTGAEDRNSTLEKEVVENTKKLKEMKEKLDSKNATLEEVNIEIANYKQKHEFIVLKIHKAEDVITSWRRT